MKILLLGEFSGVHKHLKIGLEKLGHEVLFISTGDAFKKISGDKNLIFSSNRIIRQIQKIYFFEYIKKIAKNFDVVHLLSPFFIMNNKFAVDNLIKYLKEKNRKLSLYLCSTDPIYWHIGSRCIEYSPIKDYIIQDFKCEIPKLYDNKLLLYYIQVVEIFDYLIPSMFEYAIGYKELGIEITNPVPLPVQIDNDFIFNDKEPINFLHGILRKGFKGTKIIKETMDIITQKYKNVFYKEVEHIPYDEYLTILNHTHILLDQANSYSYGMNAALSLAKGKVVMSGAEKVAMEYLGIDDPVILNLKPDIEYNVNLIESILDIDKIYELSKKSYDYAKKYHACEKVAQKFIQIWSKK